MDDLRNVEANGRHVLFCMNDDGTMSCHVDFESKVDIFRSAEGFADLPRILTEREMDCAIQILLNCEDEDFWTAFDLLKEGRLPLDGSKIGL
jgi:hypothetical protein